MNKVKPKYLNPLPGRDIQKNMKRQLEKDLYQLFLYGTKGKNITN